MAPPESAFDTVIRCGRTPRPRVANHDEDGSVLVGMKRTWSDGTTALVLSPQELVERLAALVPPPRKNQILYHGVLAAHSAWRARVVPRPAAQPSARQPKLVPAPAVNPVAGTGRRDADTRLGWADLLLRVFGEDGFRCPTCAMPMRLRSVVTDSTVARRVLAGLTRALARVPPPPTAGGDDRGART